MAAARPYKCKNMEEIIKMSDKVIYAAILGAGTVGLGTYKLCEAMSDEIKHKTGATLVIKKVLVRNLSKKREGIPDEILTDKWEDIINDKDISIVVELMGGIHPAKDYVLEALKAGRQVVTANKDLIAEYGEEVGNAANKAGADLQFEAAVAGAIPIIRPLKQSMTGNHITEIMGIVNGTTNYILTKMTESGMDYKEALAKATELGYAEADPTADVEGYDAGRKIAIMASIAFNSRVTFADVYTEGITNITAKDIKYAEAMGCTIKLLGVAKNTDTGIEVRVHPMLIPSDHPLATVNDSFNAVFVHGDAVDDAMFYGRGAGELPTASAVMGDIIDVARNIQFYCNGRIHCTCYKNLPIKKITEIESKYFMRLLVDDKPGVLAQIASTLGKNNVSIAQVIQKNKIEDQAELVVITDLVLEQNFADALVEIKGMDHTREISTVIRVY